MAAKMLARIAPMNNARTTGKPGSMAFRTVYRNSPAVCIAFPKLRRMLSVARPGKQAS